MNKKGALIFQAVVAASLIASAFFLSAQWPFIFFTVGLIGGAAFSWADATFLYPKYKDKTIHSSEQYITRSFLFLLAYMATSFFVVTSTRSPIGIGLSLGIGLVLWSELLFTLQSPAQLNSVLGVKKPLKKNELKILVGGYSVLYLVMCAMTFLK
ncbi:MAG TPA: hypothetical protein VF209_05455 [Patescibacteria group bacterium]